MAARSKARKRAVDVLYEADVRGADPQELLAERLAQADPPCRATRSSWSRASPQPGADRPGAR
jgi:hypothetical protein